MVYEQAKLRKMVDEQVSVGARVDADAEPEPADPLITPASSALERPELDRPVPPERRLLIGTLDKRNGGLSVDKEGTINRNTRLSIRNGKDNPFIGKMWCHYFIVRLYPASHLINVCSPNSQPYGPCQLYEGLDST